jgi:hypothetical protein
MGIVEPRVSSCRGVARFGPRTPKQSCARRSYTTGARNYILGCFGRSDRRALRRSVGNCLDSAAHRSGGAIRLVEIEIGNAEPLC